MCDFSSGFVDQHGKPASVRGEFYLASSSMTIFKKREGKERKENYQLHVLARKLPEVHTLELTYHFSQHMSVYSCTCLYFTRKLNFSLLTFLLESSCAIPAGNSNTTNPNVFYTVQRAKGKTELLR